MFENLSDRLERSFKILKGEGKITEINVAETLKDVRRALLDADVNYKVAKNFTDTVKKNLTAAGKVFSSRMDSLSKDFQDAMQRTEKKAEEKKPETPAAPPEPAPTAAPEEPTPQPDADDPQNPEYL